MKNKVSKNQILNIKEKNKKERKKRKKATWVKKQKGRYMFQEKNSCIKVPSFSTKFKSDLDEPYLSMKSY